MNDLSRSRLKRWLPARPADAHKGRFGHVLVLAGSRGMSGAAAVAARAALRAGAGLVTAAVPESLAAAVTAHVPEALTLPLPESKAGGLSTEAAGEIVLSQKERGYTVLALGPGLGRHQETARAVIAVLGSVKLPAVVDADGLNILSQQPRQAVAELFRRRGAPAVFTPHPGEAARLLGSSAAEVQADRRAAAARLSEEFGVAVVLKGAGSVIADGSRLALNATGNPGLAKGGTGDALTGVIAALWAQRLAADPASSAFEAAALGAYLHGLAADLAARDKTFHCLLASDVVESLPAAFRKLGA